MPSSKAHFNAVVQSNSRVGSRFYKLTLGLDEKGSQAFANVTPGQFAELNLCNVALPPIEEIPLHLRDIAQRQIILRRPFSFCDVRKLPSGQVRIVILYAVIGPATVRMTTLDKDDQLSIIGPLGNGFTFAPNKQCAVLIAGGMGAPPLEHVGEYLKEQQPDMQIIAFAGARTLEDFPFEVRIGNEAGAFLQEFDRLNIESLVATDDGSVGFKGFVTDLANDWIEKCNIASENIIIYTCGPEQMLASVVQLAKRRNIDCQISTERMMACGIGLCQSCFIETRSADSDTRINKLCCKDGPVFDGRDLIFD